MSRITADDDSLRNLNSSFPPPTNSEISSSNEIPLPTYDINDLRVLHKTLIRFVMRTFYDIPKSLVIEYIYHCSRIKQKDLADRLCLNSKQIHSYIEEFKRDKFIIEKHSLESNDGRTDRRNQDQPYYEIDIKTFINIVKYRLINMQIYVENLERQQTYKSTNYKCEQCLKEYTDLDIAKLCDPTQGTVKCLICPGNVHEDIETQETITSNRPMVTMSLFNTQMEPLFQILKQIDEIMKNEPQNGDSFSSLLSSSNHNIIKELIPSNTHRSHASNVFDHTTTLNHDIQVIIEKDDDDYSQTDIDSILPSSPPNSSGKSGKNKSSIQPTLQVTTQSLPKKLKLTNKKIASEPKPLPDWFIHSTVNNEGHHLNNSLSNLTIKSSCTSHQQSNKSTTIDDIKQMLRIHESQGKNTLTLTTSEDSLSPPTPVQKTKTTDWQ